MKPKIPPPRNPNRFSAGKDDIEMMGKITSTRTIDALEQKEDDDAKKDA
jgi:hypothetical protein